MPQNTTMTATHYAPVWGSDSIVRVDLADHGLPGNFEQFWARKIAPNRYQICCIPFFSYGIALGDEVETDSECTITRVSERAGHRTLCVAVADEHKVDSMHRFLHDWVSSTGLLHEWHAAGYLAIDLPPGTDAGQIMAALAHLERCGDLAVEVDG